MSNRCDSQDMGVYAGALCLLEVLKPAARKANAQPQKKKQEKGNSYASRYIDSDLELSDMEDDSWYNSCPRRQTWPPCRDYVIPCPLSWTHHHQSFLWPCRYTLVQPRREACAALCELNRSRLWSGKEDFANHPKAQFRCHDISDL